MALNDPTMSVPTPTGVLQGVAAFNWDGAVWQPAGRAGPSVVTPTGNLQGVAAFTGSPPQPAGRAGPGVATPTGVLDGVAVYTWSGSQWTPPGGAMSSPTSSGVLRGVAAFDWDGAQWQPAGQAGPDVATPYGVLQGVARFGWTGTAWVATGAPSLSLDFMTPGTLDPRIMFTRASTATYTDASGTIQTAAVNAPRWDYAGGVLRGLLIEEPRTNILLNSADASNASWGKSSAIFPAPTVTGNQTTAPDGTLTAASASYPAISGAGAYTGIYVGPTVTANPYTFSLYMKGSVGGEQLYMSANTNGVTFYKITATLTTAWQRFVLTTPALTAATWYFEIGVDLRDATQTAKPAQMIYLWGGQIEQGDFRSSYISTAAATVTRAVDSVTVSSANMSPWFVSSVGSWFGEFIPVTATPSGGGERIVGAASFGVSPLILWAGPANSLGQYDGIAVSTVNLVTIGVVSKGVATWIAGSAKACLNGGVVATSSGLTTGYATLATTGLRIGPSGSPSEGMTGYIRRVQYWPRVLADLEMQQVTT